MGDSELSGSSLLCVAQYWRGLNSDGVPMPLHWALFALDGATPESLAKSSGGKPEDDGQNDHYGTCYEAIGNIDTFEYSCKSDEIMEILAQNYRGCLCIGEIDAPKVAQLKDLLATVRVERGNENWNCQNWIYGAITKLKGKGWVKEEVTPSGVKNELEDILQNWGRSN
ncbi:hypothetical protein BJ138DRAFT_1146554 [Hygrophoropsis aurantiaca]|uniref:Uncharacterized protein n=1 Tax=Hygrophoropsis aurantiaca TaxID=72124 RepID=A0ACB8AJ15_9AGAM|nr:hypothetical protein BJ138DRAFT_1146554 [Hygrophoropsis aurantiaca]